MRPTISVMSGLAAEFAYVLAISRGMAIALLLSLFCQSAIAQPYLGTDPFTSLVQQEKTHVKDTRLRQLEAKLAAHVGDRRLADNATIYTIMGQLSEYMSAKVHEPRVTAPAAKASAQAQATSAGNAAADVARDQAIASIDYSSRFLKNFTVEPDNKWNRIRNQIFLPIAVLLLLPGAVLAQLKAVIAAGSPAFGACNPFDGIQRSLIAIVLIPGSYLAVNYGIDFSNSLQYTIATEYTRIFKTDMYKDAMCAEMRAFGARYISENDGSLNSPPPNQRPSGTGTFSKAEGKLWGKLVDPCSGVSQVPPDRDDASMPASTIATRLMMNGTNAGINTAWSILCAFQMAFFYYLYFVGPIMAALWVWPIKELRQAFPNWLEGVVTLCFWSLFWNTSILLMACFKGSDDTGLYIMTALNFLATASVKHAFDFGSLIKAAGEKAAQEIEKGGKSGAGKGGQKDRDGSQKEKGDREKDSDRGDRANDKDRGRKESDTSAITPAINALLPETRNSFDSGDDGARGGTPAGTRGHCSTGSDRAGQSDKLFRAAAILPAGVTKMKCAHVNTSLPPSATRYTSVKEPLVSPPPRADKEYIWPPDESTMSPDRPPSDRLSARPYAIRPHQPSTQLSDPSSNHPPSERQQVNRLLRALGRASSCRL